VKVVLAVPVEPTVSVAVLITVPAGLVTVSVTRPPAGHALRFSVNDEPRVPVLDGRTLTIGAGVGTGVGATVGTGAGGAVGTGVGCGGGGGAIVGTGVTGVTVFVGVGLGSSRRTGVVVGAGGMVGATVPRGAFGPGAFVPGAFVPVLAPVAAAGVGAWVRTAGALGSTTVLASSAVASATSQPAIATHENRASATARSGSHLSPRGEITGQSWDGLGA